MAQVVKTKLPYWRRYLVASFRRNRSRPALEMIAIGLMIAMAIGTWYLLDREMAGASLLSPAFVVLILLANLAPAIILIMLTGRRIAHRRAKGSIIGASGQLHVRLVALFSAVATIPVLVMVIVASLLFQYGVDIWYSNRARQMFENTTALSQQLYAEKQQRVMAETTAMAGDLAQVLTQVPIDSSAFANEFAYQVYRRELSEGAVISISPANAIQSLALVNPYERPTENWVSKDVAKQLIEKPRTIFGDTGQRMETVTPLPGSKNLFLFASRVTDTETLAKARRASLVLKDYNALIKRSGRLQTILNVALYAMSLLIILVAVWVALKVADRLVRPVGELVDAARKVAAGDFEARVTPNRSRDEVGILSRAFNRMTARLGEQNKELVASNDLLDRRRALIEAVMSGVTAGVIAVAHDGTIRLINAPAIALLKTASEDAIGHPLAAFSAELGGMVADQRKDGVIQISPAGEPRTLAVKIVKDEAGYVLTFDDITDQLADQRRAAWSDVARRVAHEIKNPLTPIQLAAERLQRRFQKEIETDKAAFGRLTETIVRQVGDLRRMVDEFSSFARMPKPVFAKESVVDVVREAVFLHEVANPLIRFKVVGANPSPEMVCDRRQLGQAVSNIVKNAVEAISQKERAEQEAVTVTVNRVSRRILEIIVADSGIGLPVERDRIIEPYMTTRKGGTGLGLAIVGKIVEEHMGTIRFEDNPGSGAMVVMTFDPTALTANARPSRRASAIAEASDTLPSELTPKEQN